MSRLTVDVQEIGPKSNDGPFVELELAVDDGRVLLSAPVEVDRRGDDESSCLRILILLLGAAAGFIEEVVFCRPPDICPVDGVAADMGVVAGADTGLLEGAPRLGTATGQKLHCCELVSQYRSNMNRL